MALTPPILASAIVPEPYTSIMAMDPVVYWRMDEVSGNIINLGSLASKDGVANGTPAYQSGTPIVPRNRGANIEFDGTTDYFRVTDAAITGTDPNFSFGVWIKTDGGLSDRTVFQQQDTTSAYCGFRLYTSSATLVFQSHHTDGSSQTLTVYGLNTYLMNNTVMYVGVTADDDNFSIYVNGELFGSLARTTVTYVSGSDIYIGRAEGAYRYWKGWMSDLFIVDFPMTADEHLNIWRKGEFQIERPRGDNFKDAVTLVLDASPTTMTTVGASENPLIEPLNYAGAVDLHKNVWMKFEPPDTNMYLVRASRPSGTSIVGMNLFHGPPDAESVLDLSQVSSFFTSTGSTEVREEIDWTLPPGHIYYLWAGNQSANSMNPGPFDVSFESFPVQANDNFADAEVIDVSGVGTLTSSTVGSSLEDSQESVRTGCNEHSVWYKFTADATGSITLSLGNTDNYKYFGIAAWDATADGISVVGDVDWTTPLAYNDWSADGNGEITISVISGNVYYFHVTQGNIIQVDFTLDWTDIT